MVIPPQSVKLGLAVWKYHLRVYNWGQQYGNTTSACILMLTLTLVDQLIAASQRVVSDQLTNSSQSSALLHLTTGMYIVHTLDRFRFTHG